MSDLNASIKLYLKAHGFTQGLRRSERGLKRFGSAARREFGHLGRVLGSVKGKLAALGLGFGVVHVAKQSAQLTKDLVRIRQTAEGTVAQQHRLRAELFAMSKRTGQSIASLKKGFNTLVQAGLSWDKSLATIKAVNIAMAVTGSNAQVLSQALVASGNNFDFDLSKPKEALRLLNKMTAAGRAGLVEIEDVAPIVGRNATLAVQSGMSFDQFLGIAEALSQKQLNPQILSTYMRAMMRMFTTLRNVKQITGATGIKLFDAHGNRRDVLDVIADVKKLVNEQQTEAGRFTVLGHIFKGADQRAIIGMSQLLQGDLIGKARRFTQMSAHSMGTLGRDLQDNLDTLTAQAGRLRTILRRAADDFAQPINHALAGAIQKLTTSRDKGGLGLSGGQLIGGAALGGLGLYGLARGGRGLVNRLTRGALGTAGGVAIGKTLQAETGTIPVYVVNMPRRFARAGGAGLGGKMGRFGRVAGKAGLIGAAAAAGYGLGALLNKYVIKGTDFDKWMNSLFGNDAANQAIDSTRRADRLHAELMQRIAEREAASHGTLDININADGTLSITRLESPNKNLDVNVGPTTVMP